MKIAFPFHLDAGGRVADAGHAAHLRQLIEQVLFTTPGERVNRPDFGCNLDQLVFSPVSDEAQTAARYLIQSSLQHWLGGLIKVQTVEVTTETEMLIVRVGFIDSRDGKRSVEQYSRAVQL